MYYSVRNLQLHAEMKASTRFFQDNLFPIFSIFFFFYTGHVLEYWTRTGIYQRIMGWIQVVFHFYDHSRVGKLRNLKRLQGKFDIW